jgi:hypothetical protein
MKFSQRLCEAKFRSAPIALKTLLPGQPRFSELGYGRPGTAGNPTVTTPLQALKCLAQLREAD